MINTIDINKIIEKLYPNEIISDEEVEDDDLATITNYNNDNNEENAIVDKLKKLKRPPLEEYLKEHFKKSVIKKMPKEELIKNIILLKICIDP
jgi:hypothetical protein